MTTFDTTGIDGFDTIGALTGSAAAGAFADVFGVDVSAVEVRCAGCGNSSVFARALAYLAGPGITVRCPGCAHVLARMVRTPDDVWLSLTGSASWRFVGAGRTTP